MQATFEPGLRFDGGGQLSIPPGARALSDPVRLAWRWPARVAVSFHLAAADAGVPVTRHLIGLQSTYVASDRAGNVSATTSGRAFEGRGTESIFDRPLITAVQSRARGNWGAVVAFGDSLTDGFQAPGEGID